MSMIAELGPALVERPEYEFFFTEVRDCKTKRNKRRLDVIMQIRIDNIEYLRVLDKPWKKMALCMLYEMRNHPDSPFAQWMRAMKYDDKKFLEKLKLSSPDTILRDSRELEDLGFCEKPPKPQKPQVAPDMQASATTTEEADE